jgi:dipeptidyl aminopeptidase/acylaminoacyl peptidase
VSTSTPSASTAGKRKAGPWGRAARVALVLLVGVLVLRMTGWVERLVFYFPSRDTFPTPRSVEDVWITTPDGVKLHGWFLRAADAEPGEKRPAVLHCHGNAGNIESHADFSRWLIHCGVHVLIFDYRGYGRSDAARPSRAPLRVDALAAYDALAARADVEPDRIGVYGVSLGASFALAVAGERNATCVCTVSGFSSWAGVAGDHVPLLGPALIPRGLDGEELAVKLGRKPYLIVHGAKDTIVSPRHADRLAAAAKGAGVPVEVVTVTDADHNDIADFEESREAIGSFFERTLRPARHEP